MKKSLLTLGLMAAAVVANAQNETVLFEDDFEWAKEAVSSYVNDENKHVGDVFTDQNQSNYACYIYTIKFGEIDGRTELRNRGYEFVRKYIVSTNPLTVGDADDKKECIYWQDTYLKFGKGGFQGGIYLPKLTKLPADKETVHVQFNWCPQRQRSGIMDPTELVVIVDNGGKEEQFIVPGHGLRTEQDDVDANGQSDFVKIPADIALKGATVNADTRILIRPSDPHWGAVSQHRFFLDDIKVISKEEAGVDNIIAEENATPVYYNLQGVQVNNPAKGNIYIVKKGNKVAKQLVK